MFPGLNQLAGGLGGMGLLGGGMGGGLGNGMAPLLAMGML